MEILIKMNSKGRLLIPATVRRKIKSRRFTLKIHRGKIKLEPLTDQKKIKEKYRGLLKIGLEELEERQEKFVVGGKR